MRRSARRLFALLAVASLGLPALAVYRWNEGLMFHRVIGPPVPYDRDRLLNSQRTATTTRNPLYREVTYFLWHGGPSMYWTHRVNVEEKAVGAAGLVLPALWCAQRLRAHRQSRRARAGLCGACGYDLRAHAKGERCPECGTAVG